MNKLSWQWPSTMHHTSILFKILMELEIWYQTKRDAYTYFFQNHINKSVIYKSKHIKPQLILNFK